MRAVVGTSLLWATVLALTLVAHSVERQDMLEREQHYIDNLQLTQDVLTMVLGDWHPDRLVVEEVTVTAYQSKKNQTWGDPHVNASNTAVAPGQCAVSRDLDHLLGRTIYLDGLGSFKVTDRMNERYAKSIDLWTGEDTKAARLFGRREGVTAIWVE